MEGFKNVSYMLSHIFLFTFIYLFNVHKYSKRTTIGICFLSFFLITTLDILKLSLFPDSDLCYVFVTVVQIIITQSTGIIISAYKNSKVLFMGLSASNYVIAGSLASTILYYYTGYRFFSLAGSFFIHFVILIILCVRIRKIWLAHVEKSSRDDAQSENEPHFMQNWWELCLIPICFYCSFTFIAYFPNTLDEMPANIPAVLFFVITMFVSYVVVLRYVESENKKTDIFWKNILFEMHIKGLENQYELIKQSEQNLKILRHDIRHYSGMIDTLLEEGEYEEIHHITAHINDVADANRVQTYCDNLLVNTFISQIAKRADALQIELQLQIRVEREIPINDYEFTAVIANLLENAIFTVKKYKEKERVVEGKIQCDKKHLLLFLQNPCKEQVIMDSFTGLPKSQRGQNHGLGMQSIAAFADHIHGMINCCCEEEKFSITIFSKF